MNANVLVIDGEDTWAARVLGELSGAEFEVRRVWAVEDALQLVHSAGCDVVIVDVCLGDREGSDELAGLRVLEAFGERTGHPVVIVMSAHPERTVGGVPVGLAAMAAGAFSFIRRDLSCVEWPELLRHTVELAAAMRSLAQNSTEP